MNLENNIYIKETEKYEIKNFNSSFSEKTSEYGKSVFAKRDFVKGGGIFIIAGPIVTKGTIYTIPIANGLWIDPLEYHGKYLCHSCEPNAGIKQRTIVVAFKNIKKDEEITIDYAMIVRRYGDEMTPENIICRCGSKNCRGKLGSWLELPEFIKQKYKGFVSDYLIGGNND